MSHPNHLISLKVLRLSRPALKKHDITHTAEDDIPISTPALSLPLSFGTVHVGETFSCMLSANNSNDSIYNIKLSAFIELPSKAKVNVIYEDSPESSIVLEPQSSAQKIVTFEPKEAGLHNLTIKVSYQLQDQQDAEQIFLKHYQFSATPGLSVKTKMGDSLVRGDHGHGAYTIEAQIENVSDASMTLETTQLLPAEGWQAEQFPASSENSAGPTRILLPRDVYQMGFAVTRRSQPEGQESEQVQSVGMTRFTISWRREMGEKGVMTTGPLKPVMY